VCQCVRTLGGMARARLFPLSIKRGSVTVKVYRVVRPPRPGGKGKDPRVVYTTAWSVAGKRMTRQFCCPFRAEEEARLKADALAAGRSDVAVGMAMEDVSLLSEIRRLTQDVPPLAAIEEWVRCRQLCGQNLLLAAETWARDRHAKEEKTVAEVAELFRKAKLRAKREPSTYRAWLPPLMESIFGSMPIAAITRDQLEDWIHERFSTGESDEANPSTFNTARKRFVTVWRWARKEGYLPAAAMTEPEKIEVVTEGSKRIGTIDTEGFAWLLHYYVTHERASLPALVLAGFCGLRRSEIAAQVWGDISLNKGILKVTAAKRGTAAYRNVPICDAAVEFLRACERGEPDEVVGDPLALDNIRAFARITGIVTPPNCFRHTRISQRVAQTQNIPMVAIESGNSVGVINKHYRELRTKEEGEEWFSLTPAKVAQMQDMVGYFKRRSAREEAAL
jgi:integrase